jgi:hypothetical protein
MNIMKTVIHVTSNVQLVTLTLITVSLVPITDLVNHLVLPVQMDISMIQSMLIVKIVQVNSLSVLLVMLILVGLVKLTELLHIVLVLKVLLKPTVSVLIVHTIVPLVLEETQTTVSLVLEKESPQTLVNVHTENMTILTKMLNVSIVHTNVLDVNTPLITVLFVPLTEPQLQIVTVNSVGLKLNKFVLNVTQDVELVILPSLTVLFVSNQESTLQNVPVQNLNMKDH